MRLWHQYLIPYLDNKRLIGQHRECCALRGNGWGRRHSTVNYVFEHPIALLVHYHTLVMDECMNRGFKIDSKWYDAKYRGKNSNKCSDLELSYDSFVHSICNLTINCDFLSENFIYVEHNPKYLLECLENLKIKNAQLINGKCIDELINKLT